MSLCEKVVPARLKPVPAEYVVLVSVEAIVKLGYVPVMVTLLPCVKDTVWSGAVLVNVVPDSDKPVPAL